MEDRYSVLFADDEPVIRGMVEMVLTRAGYRVLLAENGLEALQLCRENQPNLVLLDIMMPQLDGLEAARRMRQFSNVPVVFLTVMTEEEDMVQGFNAGAYDYIAKPFRPKELVARIQAILQRTNGSHGLDGHVLTYNDLELDPKTHQVRRAGHVLEVTLMGFQLLAYFMQHVGEIVSKAELLREVWACPDPVGGDNMVEAAIKRLRRDLQDDPHSPRYIKTVWGLGYRFGESRTGE